MTISAISSFSKKHILFLLYFGMLFFLLWGVIHFSGTEYLPEIGIYIGSFICFYFLFSNLAGRINTPRTLSQGISGLPYRQMMLLALAGITSFIIIHFLYLGHVPAWTALNSLDYYYIANIRGNIIRHDSTAIKYLSAFTVKAFIPFFLLLLFHKREKFLFWVFLVISAFYCIALMQKSLIVTALIPLGVYCLLNRKWFMLVLLPAIATAGVFSLVFITNPQLRSSPAEVDAASRDSQYKPVEEEVPEEDLEVDEKMNLAKNAIVKRIFYTPGMVVVYWFEAIPEKFPFGYGCAYNFLAPALGCDYKDYNYSRKIYDSIYLKEKSKGLKGTVTAASFMYDYANFGKAGMVLSGFILALILTFVNLLMKGNFIWKLSINVLFILWLSSSALSSTMLSGGWGPILFLFWLFLPYINKPGKTDEIAAQG